MWFPLPFPLGAIVGDKGNFSVINKREESISSNSSSLVYPFLCIADTFLDNGALPPASATFSATSDNKGGVYVTGAAE